jgi:two-component system sensor histidine kinase PilS (NtrC family)
LAVLLIREHDLLSSQPIGSVPPLYSRPPGFVVIVVLLLTIIYLLLVRVVKDRPAIAAKLAACQIFVDIFMITLLIWKAGDVDWKTGSIDSHFVVLYLISICSAGFVLKWNASIYAAIVSSILYAGVALAYRSGFVPEEIQSDPVKKEVLAQALSGISYLSFLLLPIFAFLIAGVLAGALSRKLVAARLMRDDILEGIGKGVLMLDEKCRVVYHNREFSRLLDLKENPDRRLVGPLLGENVERLAREALETRSERQVEISHVKPNGTHVPLSVHLNPIVDPDEDQPFGLTLALDDITTEKRMAELDKQRHRIETMGHISATIAHEIRNPLASIRGAVQEIVRALEVPESKKILLEIVLSESDRLDQIITDFLHFARMRPPGLVRTDMKRVLSDVRYLLMARPESREMQITLSGDCGDPINVDAEQLRQLFLNLGLNALQAMETSSRKVLKIAAARVLGVPADQGFDTERRQERQNRPGILIEVEDSGEGMTAQVLAQVFEPFFTTKPAGTGLGLAIVDRIVNAHDGAIAVQSAPGRGTTVRIWLPADMKVGVLASGPRTAIVL